MHPQIHRSEDVVKDCLQPLVWPQVWAGKWKVWEDLAMCMAAPICRLERMNRLVRMGCLGRFFVFFLAVELRLQ